MNQKKKRIGEMLVEAGAIDEYQLKAALNRQERWGKKLGETLIEMGFITEEVLLKTLSKALNIPSIQIEKYEIKREIVKLLSRQLCVNNLVIPLAKKLIGGKNRLVVAMADPTNYAALDEIQFKTGMKVLAMVTTISSVHHAIAKYYPPGLDDKDPITYVNKPPEPMEVIRQGREDTIDFEDSYKEVPDTPKPSKPGAVLDGKPEDKIEGLERVSVRDLAKAIDDNLEGYELEPDMPTPKPFVQEEYEESTGVFRDDNVFNSLVKILKNKSLINDAEFKTLLGAAAKSAEKDLGGLEGFRVLIDLLHKKKLISDSEKKMLKGE